jgi:hypothetical protein
MSKLTKKLKEPHMVAWIILIVMILATLIFFNFFKQYFLKIALIGLLFILFYFFDGLLFKPVANRTKDIFSGNLFVKRWKAFPIFLAELYLIYFLSSLLENWLSNYLSPQNIQWWYVLVWLGVMYGFYYFKASKD